MQEVTGFYCVPACIACKRVDSCAKMFDVPADETVSFREPFRPNRLEACILPCGCEGIPWPVIEHFGLNIAQVLCERHGWVNTTKAWRKKSEREASKRANAYYRKLPNVPPF